MCFDVYWLSEGYTGGASELFSHYLLNIGGIFQNPIVFAFQFLDAVDCDKNLTTTQVVSGLFKHCDYVCGVDMEFLFAHICKMIFLTTSKHLLFP